MSLFESTLTRWTTEMIELSADTTRFPSESTVLLHSAHVSANSTASSFLTRSRTASNDSDGRSQLDEYRHTSSESATVDIDSEVVDDSVSWSRVTRSETAGPERPTSSPIALNERRAFSANSERISMSVSSKSRILAEKDARCDTILQKTLWNTSFHGRSNSSIEAANDKEEPSVSLTGMSHTISVEGMTCSHCEQIVEEAGYTAHA